MDGELSTFEHVLLGAHLAVCRDCRRFSEDVRWQTESLRAAPLERLSRSVSLPARHSWRRPALGVSTAAVAASIVALLVGLRGPSTTHAPVQTSRSDRNIPALSQPGESNGLPRVGASSFDQSAAALRGDPTTIR